MQRQVAVIRLLFFTVVVLTATYALVRVPTRDGLARVHMLNVGQGDSFLIEAANGRQLLIDGGKDEKVLTELAKVMPKGDRSIDVVLATHPDADHIGGLSLVLDRYTVGLFLTSEVFTNTETVASLYRSVIDEGIPAYFVRKGMTLSLDQELATDFSVLFPDRDTDRWETNAASVVGRLDIGERSILFTGDAPSSVENALAKADPSSVDVDILKLGHHGSKTSSDELFLKATSPILALISAGAGNTYGHPAPEVTSRLKALSIPSVSTQNSGTYTFTTDGMVWGSID